jgi:hypothetical protein
MIPLSYLDFIRDMIDRQRIFREQQLWTKWLSVENAIYLIQITRSFIPNCRNNRADGKICLYGLHGILSILQWTMEVPHGNFEILMSKLMFSHPILVMTLRVSDYQIQLLAIWLWIKKRWDVA